MDCEAVSYSHQTEGMSPRINLLVSPDRSDPLTSRRHRGWRLHLKRCIANYGGIEGRIQEVAVSPKSFGVLSVGCQQIFALVNGVRTLFRMCVAWQDGAALKNRFPQHSFERNAQLLDVFPEFWAEGYLHAPVEPVDGKGPDEGDTEDQAKEDSHRDSELAQAHVSGRDYRVILSRIGTDCQSRIVPSRELNGGEMSRFSTWFGMGQACSPCSAAANY